jgi:hypothetical protein
VAQTGHARTEFHEERYQVTMQNLVFALSVIYNDYQYNLE